MKKLFVALCLSFVLAFSGCQDDGAKLSIPSGSLVEKDAGKLFAVQKGSKVTFSFKTDLGEDFFWAVGKMKGDFEVVSDVRVGNRQNIGVVINTAGSITFNYTQFTATGAKKLNELTFNLKVE
jgi:hypothetical protein